MKKRIRSSRKKDKKDDIRAEALENLKATREKLEASHGDMLKLLGEQILKGDIDLAAMMGRDSGSDLSIDKGKSLETIHKFLSLTDSDFLKEQVRKSLARSLH